MRSFRDAAFWGACGLAFMLIVLPALSVVMSVFHQALPALDWSLFTTPTNGAGGGLENAILGTLVLLLGVLVIAGTVGIAGGIYLAELSSPRLGGVLRFFSEILAGMPSIVIGYVGYVTLVVQFHWGYSLLAAVLALSALVVPYIVKTTEVALRQVPTALRDAAAGLGVHPVTTVWRIVVPVGVPGIVSGLIVALAISTGETAPLLFTAGMSNSNPTAHLFHHQVGYLTGVTFTDVSLPGASAHALAAAAGAVTLGILLVLIALGRILSSRSARRNEGMAL
ncbi:MAG: ABC transporter permease subunit [Acidimicrobiales bacterium]